MAGSPQYQMLKVDMRARSECFLLNALTGKLPAELAKLVNLTDMRISDFTGRGSSYPPLSNMESIKTFHKFEVDKENITPADLIKSVSLMQSADPTTSALEGSLSDGTVIAVILLSPKSKQGNREFVNEIGMISALQPPNLVKLYGCCVGENQLKLVYEYMENNCLSRALFDDLWNCFDYNKVGIPIEVKGCKLILTTRSFGVCKRMVCQKTIKVEPLSMEEAWALFIKIIGCIPPEVEEIAKSVASECAGLPLGIKTMAGTMRGVDDICEWRNALEELKQSRVWQEDMDEKSWFVEDIANCNQQLIIVRE
ncbi:hypothetical protein NC652_040441 [Populus alba x Populus x berolinensis]|nr:hypothetical protein NC652_040441 [Populus alba x Populus x berolinensis]